MTEENVEKENFLTEEEVAEISKARSYDYELDWPIEIGTEEAICTVTLHRFKGKDIKAISKIKDEYEQGEAMIMRSSKNLLPIHMDEMEATDIQCLMEICAVFMDASQKRKRKNTGK